MKDKIKLVVTFVAIGLLFTLTNCQKDDDISSTETSSKHVNGIRISKISFEEFKNNTKAFSEFQNAISQNRLAKSMVKDTVGGFYYYGSEVSRIEYNKNITYTFEIFNRNAKKDHYENLVIFEDENQKMKSYILDYHFDATDLDNLSRDKEIVGLSEKSVIRNIDGELGTGIIRGSDGNCYAYSNIFIPDPDIEIVYINGYPYVRVECPPSLQLSEDGSGGAGSSNGGGSSPGGGSSGTESPFPININIIIPGPAPGTVTDPGGVVGGNYDYPEPVVTHPVVNFNYKIYSDLMVEENDIYLWLFDNLDLKDMLDDFLNSQEVSFQDKQDFADKLIHFANQDFNKKEQAIQILDFLEEEEYSEESIEIVEIAIDDIENEEIPEHILNYIHPECQYQIVKDVNNSASDIGEIFQSVFGNTANTHNIQYRRSDDLGFEELGTTQPARPKFVIPNPDNGTLTYNLYIYLSTDHLLTSTDLSIAMTIIHENLHAILLYLMHNQELYTIDDNPTYSQLLNDFSFEVGHDPNEHHTFMTNYIQNLADALKSYALSKGYNLPDSYYTAMAWQGLTHIDDENNDKIINPEFINLVPNAAERTDIQNTLRAELENQEFNGQSPTSSQNTCN